MFRSFIILTLFFVQSLYGQLDLSERLFHSKIFNTYQQQFIENVLPLSEQFQLDEENPRLFYEKFLTVLRSSKTINVEAYRWFFLRVELTNEIIQDAKERLNISLQEDGFSQPHDIAKIINKLFQETNTNSEYNGSPKNNERNLDPFYEGNFPYLLHTGNFAGHEVHFIRMPVPARTTTLKNKIQTIDDIKINEEFEAFLTLQAAENKNHFYVSFLNDWKGLENILFHEKLAKLEQHPTFGQNFFYMTLDKDSTFYYQKEEFTALDNSQEFLKMFLTRLIKGQGYRWPSRLNSEAWSQKCLTLVNELFEKEFNGKKNLSITERQNFIEISYSRIIRAMLEEIKPDTCNLTCHYTIDRAPSTTAIFLFDLLYQPGKGIPNREALKLIALLINQPILLHNRAAHEYRVNRVINVLNSL